MFTTIYCDVRKMRTAGKLCEKSSRQNVNESFLFEMPKMLTSNPREKVCIKYFPAGLFLIDRVFYILLRNTNS